MADKKRSQDKRQRDPYLDRRSGEDRREAYDADYFENDGKERRKGKDRRKGEERRNNCVRVSKWTSVCKDDIDGGGDGGGDARRDNISGSRKTSS